MLPNPVPLRCRWRINFANRTLGSQKLAIDALLPAAEQSYRTLEAELGIQIYHPIPLRRFCQNEDDLKRIGRRSRNPRYANVFGNAEPAGAAPWCLT